MVNLAQVGSGMGTNLPHIRFAIHALRGVYLMGSLPNTCFQAVLDPAQYLFLVMNVLFYAMLLNSCDEWSYLVAVGSLY
jgi:hypothetical protein